MIIRLARVEDAPGILEIYAPFCLESAVSFETQVPSLSEMRQRIARTTETLPWLVCADEQRVLGYAYASKHRDRAAYRWSVDVSVYVREGLRGRGLGRALYTALFGVLELQGFQNAVAGATLPNPGSIALHRAMGFKRVGVYRGIGYKCGQWHDVEWLERAIGTRTPDPEEPTPLPSVVGTPGWESALAAGLALVKPGTNG